MTQQLRKIPCSVFLLKSLKTDLLFGGGGGGEIRSQNRTA